MSEPERGRRRPITRLRAFEEILLILNSPQLSREDSLAVLRALDRYKTWVAEVLEPEGDDHE